MQKLWIACCFCLLMNGCAQQELTDRSEPVASMFSKYGFVQRDIPTQDFTMRVWQRSAAKSPMMHVYIEGDGLSWVTRYQPSLNPTPLRSIVPTLAVKDHLADQVVYLARPCQYVDLTARPCSAVYWTHSRFAPEVINAMNQVLSRLKQETQVERFILIGYSGGGAVAALIAAQRQDVAALITIAGNLDPEAWTRRHELTDLHGSLNPRNYAPALTKVPQWHFVGAKDHNIPVNIYQSYREVFPLDADIHLEVIDGFDHKCCWTAQWPDLLKRQLN